MTPEAVYRNQRVKLSDGFYHDGVTVIFKGDPLPARQWEEDEEWHEVEE